MVTTEIIEDALSAHNLWKLRLRNMIGSRKIETPIETIIVDDQCQFGKWLYGPTFSVADTHGPHYRAVLALHKQFHAAAARVAQSVVDGNVDAARRLMLPGGEYWEATAELESALREWGKAAEARVNRRATA